MTTTLIIRRLVLLLALLCCITPARAQNTNAAASPPGQPGSTNAVGKTGKKSVAGPFHGKLLAMDQIAKTITVGKRTFQITSDTRIKKGGKPATFADGVVGEPVSGYVKPAQEGKWIAVSVNFGPKVPETASGAKRTKAEKEQN